MSERPIFKMLWDMTNKIRDRPQDTGTIISNYAGIIDDRIENSGYSRSVDSLKLYTSEQLQEELDERTEEEEL